MCHFRRYSRWRSRAPFSLFKLSALAGRALGVQIWEIKRSEIAFVNRRECANLGDTFGVQRYEKPLYSDFYIYLRQLIVRSKLDKVSLG